MVYSFLGKQIAHFHSLTLFTCISASILFIFSNIPGTDGHISSILGTGRKRVQFGKHVIFCDYGPEDGTPPLLSHIRVSRGPSQPMTSEEDAISQSVRLKFLKSPSLQHKLLRHLSLFPDGYVARMGTRSRSNMVNDINIDSRPNLSSKTRTIPPPANTDYENDGAADDENYNDILSNVSPEFIPYISARVLSNVPRFFDHVRENLRALHQDQHVEGETPSPDNIFANYLREKGTLGRKKHNEASKEDSHEANSVGMDDEAFLRKANNFNPAWLLTNLGLGKRGR